MHIERHILYSALVWMCAGAALTVYTLLGFVGVHVPGIEDIVAAVSNLAGWQLYAIAVSVMFVEGLYIIGSVFPGSAVVLLLAIVSQLGGAQIFILTILSIFVGWVLSAVVNIAGAYYLNLKKFEPTLQEPAKDWFFATWYPSFRASHEVAQIVQGVHPLSVFVSAVRVRVFATFMVASFTLILPLFVNVNAIENKEGFIVNIVIAAALVLTGVYKIEQTRTNRLF